MASTSEHYERLLGPVYAWMVGDVDAAMARSRAELAAIGLGQGQNRLAVDLGAGIGLHALPLAQLGFSVVAIDGCKALVDELATRAASLPVRAVPANLLDFRAHVSRPADVILCMGDTLTHLADRLAVEKLLVDVRESLAPDGVFVATFRDYVTSPLVGEARFILVRGDEQRILTCFLEYGASTVMVHDLLHERRDGAWQLRASSYPKLRLDDRWVVSTLSSLGLSVSKEIAGGGMIRLVARWKKPAD